MSSDFKKAYTKAVQLTEVFASFFDRITSNSSNYPHHAKSLLSLKAILYNNLHNPKNVDAEIDRLLASDDFYLHSLNEHKFAKDQSTNPNSLTSIGGDAGKEKKVPDLHISSENLLNQAYDSYIGILENRDSSKISHNSEDAAMTFESEYNSNIKGLINIFEFLSVVKATEHPDLNPLFLMATDYSHVRIFSGSHQSLFLALAFIFFERLLLGEQKMESLDPTVTAILKREVQNSASHAPSSAYKNFVSKLKDGLETKNSQECVSLFDSMCLDKKTYEASLSFFKELVLELLTHCHDSPNACAQSLSSSPFQWINEVAKADESFFQIFAKVMNTTLVVSVLTSEKMIRKTFTGAQNDRSSPQPSQKVKEHGETYVFHDKRSGTSYIIYKSRESTRLVSPDSKNLSQYNTNAPVHINKSPSEFVLDTNTQNKRETIVSHSSAQKDVFDLLHPELDRNKLQKTEESKSMQDLDKRDHFADEPHPKGRETAPISNRNPESYAIKLYSPSSETKNLIELTGAITIPPVGNTIKAHESKTMHTAITPSAKGDGSSVLTPGSIMGSNKGKEHEMSLHPTFGSGHGTSTTLPQPFPSELSPMRPIDFSHNSPFMIERAHSTPNDNLAKPVQDFEAKSKSTAGDKEVPVEKKSNIAEKKSEIKAIAGHLKEKFGAYNKEFQRDESEINNVISRYLKHHHVEKKLPGRMVLLLDRYDKIVQKKHNNNYHLQLDTGMRMDSK